MQLEDPAMEIEDPQNWALFLDLDGTLIDISSTPDGVTVPDGLVPLLARLSAGLHGALAIVTGRPISDIDRFLAPLKLVAAGVHGAELRTMADGEMQFTTRPLDQALVEAVSRLGGIAPGVVVEPKGSSIAVHYRLAPKSGPQIEAALQSILRCGPPHLIVCKGRKVFEVVPRQVSKGAALETILTLPEFRGRRPVMIGDDVSDQSALDAAMRLDGVALRVSGEHFCREVSDFDGPAHVRTWLSALVKRLDA
jgi:trehalose 6-phosphate phosphatase